MRAAAGAGHAVVPLPGPSAVLAALIASGLLAERFVFLGFPPRKGVERARLLERVAGSEETVVLFESPERLGALLGDLAKACGDDRRVSVGRELTKVHEEVVRGTLSEALRYYDEALQFFVGCLGFILVEDTYVAGQDKRWVVVAPPGGGDCRLLLARASTQEQKSRVGDQTGGRVSFFLSTDDFWCDYEHYKLKGVEFVRPPKEASYGTVAVFKDLYGNLWDLYQPGVAARGDPSSPESR